MERCQVHSANSSVITKQLLFIQKPIINIHGSDTILGAGGRGSKQTKMTVLMQLTQFWRKDENQVKYIIQFFEKGKAYYLCIKIKDVRVL